MEWQDPCMNSLHSMWKVEQSSAPPKEQASVADNYLEGAGGVDGPCKGDPQLVVNDTTTVNDS